MLETEGTVRRMRTAVAIAAGIGALALPVAAPAQEGDEPAEPVFSAAEASAQLDQAVEALTNAGSKPVEPTDELRDLAVALPYLDNDERRVARRILARPPAGEGNQSDAELGATWSQAATDSRESYHSPGGQFRIHYVTETGDAPDPADTNPPNGVPDYVDKVAARADRSEEALNDDLGWPAPKSDGGKGDLAGPATGRTDIYLSDLCCKNGTLYGYAAPDDGSAQCNQPPFRCYAYLVLDEDYVEPSYGYGGDPEIPLSVTTAHEYNHILQFRLDAFQDTWMFESTAVWAEEQVFPDADDWLVTYMPRWAREPFVPVAKSAPRRWYGSGVWNHWLQLGAGYGPDVILDAWKKSRKTKPRHFAVAAYDRAIRRNGGMGFSQEFGRFAAATAEWQVEDGDFPGADANEPDETQFPDVERHGRVRLGSKAKHFKLDHTAYRMFRVNPRSANRVRLKVKAPRNVRTAIALVGRKGDAETGDIKRDREYSGKGGKLTVRLAGVQDYERITAMVANADGRVRGRVGDDWDYTRDNERFRVSLRRAARR